LLNTIEIQAALENCRTLIDQINARLSTEEPFVNGASAVVLLLHLESAATALGRSLQSTRQWGAELISKMKLDLNYRWS
jgi:hypothetical protein